jgi:hypothetical protein
LDMPLRTLSGLVKWKRQLWSTRVRSWEHDCARVWKNNKK